MAQSPAAVINLAERLAGELTNDRRPEGRIGLVKRYLHGDHDLPYAPQKVQHLPEYRNIAEKSITNWLPQVSNAYTQGLFVEGFRGKRSKDNAAPWETWRANGMAARQTITTRGALEYGVSYGLTLPGVGGVPVMRALPPTRSIAFYESEDDAWPVVGLWHKGETADGEKIFEVYDDEFVYTVLSDNGKLKVQSVAAHRLGVCPLTRFRTRLGGASVGVIYPLKTVQDRINETVFAWSIALQFASFRQRWATGLLIEEDEDGNPVAPFEAGADRLWTTDSHEARFGDFAQTMTTDHRDSYLTGVRTLAALGQISPNVMTGDLINLSAEALAQLQDATRRQRMEFATLFSESYEQWLRLTAVAAGDGASAVDLSSEIRWRDDEARALKDTVDALGVMVTTLQVPPRAIWERIPGVTDGDVERWANEAESADGMALLAAALDRQSTPQDGQEPPQEGAEAEAA